MRLQREAAASLRPEDYADGLELDLEDQDGGSGAEDEEDEQEQDRTMGGAAARVSSLSAVGMILRTWESLSRF